MQSGDAVLVSGHTVAGVESHTVIVNAASANEAENRLSRLLSPYGAFGRWEANVFEPPFGFSEDR